MRFDFWKFTAAQVNNMKMEGIVFSVYVASSLQVAKVTYVPYITLLEKTISKRCSTVIEMLVCLHIF